jgi:hypothetical protein
MSGIIVGGSFKNPNDLVAMLAKAFENWVTEDIQKDYWQEQFRDMDRWAYGRETRRKNGDLIGEGRRDIYDLGALYESGLDNFNINLGSSNIVASWTWDATNPKNGYHYAVDVHEGLGTSAGFPRQWTDELASPALFETSDVRLALKRRIKFAFSA